MRRIRGLRFAFNCGQSAALWAGMNAARGKYIVTLDADLQNDPRDVPQFLQALEKFDCVCGSRVQARGQGDGFVRIVSSRIANWVRNKMSGENVTDAGCCYRAFKRECIDDLKFFKGMHRFLPTLFKIEGFHRHGNSNPSQCACRRPKSLRRLEPVVCVFLRSARGSLDEKADVSIQNF
ncbi:MAG: glycosyltransferase [Limisphaerales bacterium]